MKALRTFAALTGLSIAASAQPKPNPPAEQRFFNLEDAVLNQVQLSDAELAALGNDDLMRTEMSRVPPITKLSQEGLAAGVVHLCGSGERDIVVVGNGSPFIGANVGPFWIIRDLPAGPLVVLSAVSLGLTVDTKRSNKCLDVEAFGATAVEGTTTDFRFNGQKYVISKQKTAPLGK